MDITFLHTADNMASSYSRLLDITARTFRAYCAKRGLQYQQYLGIVRGFHPWHATYNRIPLLLRFLDAGYRGWVCYVDADAYIADLDFDLASYLIDKSDVAIIAAPGGPNAPWWNVNAGVLFFNLEHPITAALIREWNFAFDRISDDQLKLASRGWGGEFPNDQELLQTLLRDKPEIQQHALIDNTPPRLLNYHDGRFIRQALRVSGSIEDREKWVKSEVERVLGQAVAVSETTAEKQVREDQFRTATMVELVTALYRCLLLVREPDPAGLASTVDGVLSGRLDFESVLHSWLNGLELSDLPRAALMAQFATALYRCLLLREPDRPGLANAVNQLLSGRLDFEATLRSCLNCPEFQNKIPQFVQTYAGYRQTSAGGPFDYVQLLALIKRVVAPTVYLEVGVAGGATLASDPLPDVVIGIDPNPVLTSDAVARLATAKNFTMLKATSDEAFAQLVSDDSRYCKMIDMSYVDGLHHAEVALRDIANCAGLSRRNALICVHDVIPGNEEQASRVQCPGPWMGDVYKIVPIIWAHFPDFPTILIDGVPPSGMFILRNTGNMYEQIMQKYAALVHEMEDLEFTTTMHELKAKSVSWNTSEFTNFLVQAVGRREPLVEFARGLLRPIGEIPPPQ